MDIVQADKSTKVTVTPFASSSTYDTEVVQWMDPDSKPLFQQTYDSVVNPGNHWLRGVSWLWGQSYVYTTDHSARSWEFGYELITFPIKIASTTSGAVKNVVLKYNSVEIYNSGSTNTYDSLTLLLPQNETGNQYELYVDGRGPVNFNAGLKPVTPGNPKDEQIVVDAAVPGTGAVITVKSLEKPETFPNQTEWDSDTTALSGTMPSMPSYTHDNTKIASHLGVDVPRSPLTVYHAIMPHGMGAGSYYDAGYSGTTNSYSDAGGTLAEFATLVSNTGYDEVSEITKFDTFTDSSTSCENLAIELARKGVKLRLVSGTGWGRPYLAQPNLAFLSYNMADYHGPLYRNLQLEMQRMNNYPNLAGVSLGADNSMYEPYWGWAPPIPNRPWGEAFVLFQQGRNLSNLTVPLAPSLQNGYSSYKYTHEYFASNQSTFVDYINSYNEVYKQYGYFSKSVTGIDPKLTFTTGSYGSSPGGGAYGGYPWGSAPGQEMHEGMSVQTVYDWNERYTTKPMHIAQLIDVLRSYDPAKITRATVDDFRYHFGKMDREKTYALALTRGIQAIGNNIMAHDIGDKAQTTVISEQTALFNMLKKYGGTYAMTEPTPTVGIMYVQEQSLFKPTKKVNPTDTDLIDEGPHEGKVTEALVFTHAAGWPSKVITPEELKRGLPSSMKAILLVGLNNYDTSWSWSTGLNTHLQSFIDNGGKIIKDSESSCPVTATSTTMAVRSYILQGDVDKTNEIISRNSDNITKFKTVMSGISSPIVTTGVTDAWAVPTRAGDTQYVTVVNQKHDTAEGETQHLIGQTVTLTWNGNSRPIYDVKLGSKLTQTQANSCDLTTDGFRYYALPPADVTTPSIGTITKNADGHYEVTPTITNGAITMSGIPLEITVTHNTSSDTATVYSATGLTAKLPLADTDPAGTYTIKVKELLSGLSATTTKTITNPSAGTAPPVKTYRDEDIKRFSGRTSVPLTIALTSTQNSDSSVVTEANRLRTYYQGKGRTVSIRLAEPNDAVKSLQTYAITAKYPRWSTVDEDVILIGKASNNVLLLDQARGGLLPDLGTGLATGKAAISYANSPFVSERDVVNIMAGDNAGITAAVDYIINNNAAVVPSAPTLPKITKVTNCGVDLAWAASNGSLTGYKVERRKATETTWTQVGTTGSTTTKYVSTGLSPDTMYFYRIRAYNSTGNSSYSDEIKVYTKKLSLPSGWSSQDIGSVAEIGSADYNSNTYYMAGSGDDIWATADEFQYVYMPASGDCSIVARVSSVQNTNSYAKAGIIIRETLNAKSKNVGVFLTPSSTNGIRFQTRTTAGGTTTSSSVTGKSAPQYLKLVRLGNNFSAYYSSDGSSWTQIGTTLSVAMNTDLYIGLAVTSHADGTLNTSTFDNVNVSP